jgi:inosose dehydratase
MKVAYHTGPWRETFADSWSGVRDAGFAAVETYCLSQWFEKPGAFKKILDDAGLSLAAMECGGDWIVPARAEIERDAAERLARFLSHMGANAMVVSGGRRPPEGTSVESYDALGAVLSRLGETCRYFGLALCYHPKRGTLVEYRDQIELLMERSDPGLVSLCLDSGDLARAGSDPLEVVKTYGERIRHVHLKDLDWRTHRPVSPGAGSLELAELLKDLDERGFVDWITVELSESADPLADARASLAFLQDHGFVE